MKSKLIKVLFVAVLLLLTGCGSTSQLVYQVNGSTVIGVVQNGM